MHRGEIKVFSCRSGKSFSLRVIKELNKILEISANKVSLGNYACADFADGEVRSKIGETVRGKDIYLIQQLVDSSNRSINDNIMEMLFAANAIIKSQPAFLTLVIPYLAYSRQDRPLDREAASASCLSDLIKTVGVNSVMTMDVHADQISGMYEKMGFDNMRASKVLIPTIKENINLEDVIVISPDAGGAKRADYFAKKLKTKMAVMHKNRDYDKINTVNKTELIGSVGGKKGLIIDDIVDTGGSIVNAVKELYHKGATSITVACSHALLNGNAKKNFSKLHKERKLEYLVTTDTVLHKHKPFWLKEVSVSHLFANAIYNMNNNISVSKLYN